MWKEGFTRDVQPVQCHSHNDYWRRIPLYDALAVGCASVEADVWLRGDDLLIGHKAHELKRTKSLQSLYLDPLSNILAHQNADNLLTEGSRPVGVFDVDPDKSLILLLDVKTGGDKTWQLILKQLESLHTRGWLTVFNGTTVIPGPVTVVGTGNTPADYFLSSTSSNRYTFLDAPITRLDAEYTSHNSYFASASLKDAIGNIRWGGMDVKQEIVIKSQIENASVRGLVPRYWDTPSWPASTRIRVWEQLVSLGTGILNVDDIVSAAKWNWDWCIVLGISLCF
ncbi:Altered inheritance of mitochondria protein 6 [Cadophora gregata]|uniref:Altered inheritance of mitochondria protein 6 n=1 Tax=Cadophora gregata TaxID=51156 RepID=UPI0026DD0A7A|nr:Altered inheritance of mitochondria protein 6 [Cadophora gregata]KAK0099636.1 Altered inheritance of mitochondria protein 6 [Cadophora gregata f. sp. sojae]KAK0116453.1 Altered inheritance of mitochondria protein 6 [Cadophora gregata]